MYSYKNVFAAACTCLMLFGIAFVTLGALLPILVTKYNLSPIAAGGLASLLSVGVLGGSLLFGPVADGFGYKKLIIISTLLVVIGFLGIALSTAYIVLPVSLVIIGVGGGVLNGCSNALVADISSNAKGANLTFLGAFFGLGALGMPALLGIMTKQFTYETILLFTAIGLALPLIYFFIIQFPVPKHAQGFPLRKGIRLLKETPLILLSFVLFCESGLESSVTNWITSFLQKSAGLSLKNALFALTVVMLSMTIARIAGGFLLKRLPTIKVLSFGMIIAFCGIICLFFAHDVASSFIAMALLGAGFSAVYPVVLSYISELYASLSGTAFSVAFVIGLFGNISANYTVGVVSNYSSIIHFPFILLFYFGCLSIILSLAYKKYQKALIT